MAELYHYSGFKHDPFPSTSNKKPQQSRAHQQINIHAFNGLESSQNSQIAQYKCHECRLVNSNTSQMNRISPSDLYARLKKARNLNCDPDFVLVDTRDTAAYFAEHIVSSLSFNCHSKIMARRAIKLWSDHFANCSLAGPSHCAICDNQNPKHSLVIIYDEEGELLPPLHLFVEHLIENKQNNILFLDGGLKAFLKQSESVEDFIDSGLRTNELRPSRQPTTSLAEPRISILAVNSASSTQEAPLNYLEKVLTKNQQQLNATFPPKSVPMTRLVLSSMLIKTTDQTDGKSELRSAHGGGSDVFGAVISNILPNLYLGNARDAQDQNLLEQLNITHILNVTDSVPNAWENKIHYLRLPAVDNDSQNLKPLFDQAFDFIESAIKSGGTVLVHCQAGVSRSVTIVLAYMLRRFRDLTLDKAMERVQMVRPIAGPNLNFMGQLQAYHRELIGAADSKASSVSLRPGTKHSLNLSDLVYPDWCVHKQAAGQQQHSRRGHSRNTSNGSMIAIRSGSHDTLCDQAATAYKPNVDVSPHLGMSPMSSEDGHSGSEQTSPSSLN